MRAPRCSPRGLEGVATQGPALSRDRRGLRMGPRRPQSAFWLSQNLEVGWGHSPVVAGRAPGPHRPLCPKVLPQ